MPNVRSLLPKMDELYAICEAHSPDIVVISETWLNNYIPESAVELPNYVCFRRDSGVCAFINLHFPCQRLQDFEVSGIESLWILIRPFRLPRSISCTLIGVVYHPPHSNSERNLALMSHLQKKVDTVLLKHPDALVVVHGSRRAFCLRMHQI